MKKVKIVYFSGTNNTKRVVDRIGQVLQSSNVPTSILKVEDIGTENFIIDSNTILIIGFPVYLFDAPKIIYDFIEKLPAMDSPIPLFILTTKAWASGNSAYYIDEMLKHKNYYLAYTMDFICPSNGWINFFSEKHILNRLSKVENKLVNKTDIFSKKIMDEAITTNNEPTKIRKNPLFKMGEILGEKIEHKLFTNLNINHTECIQCGKCISLCPVNKFYRQDKNVEIKDDIDCMRCLRCINNCPTACINFGNKTIGKRRYNVKLQKEMFKKTNL